MTTESILFLVIAVSNLIWSIQLYRKKWVFIGAGFNTMNKEQHAKYDINRLSKSLCIPIFMLSLAFFSLIFLPEGGEIIMACIIVVIVISIVVIGNSTYVKIKETSTSDSN